MFLGYIVAHKASPFAILITINTGSPYDKRYCNVLGYIVACKAPIGILIIINVGGPISWKISQYLGFSLALKTPHLLSWFQTI